jgi:PHP family Zn ribbon phosphoesterase
LFEALLDFVVIASTQRRVSDDEIIDAEYHEKMRVHHLIIMKSMLSVIIESTRNHYH